MNLTLGRITIDDVRVMAAAFASLGWPGKDTAQFTSYVAAQEVGERVVLVARVDTTFAGYGCVVWRSPYEPYERAGIPEIQDLNVLPAFRRRGIGTALLDALEELIATRSPVAGIGVGVYADYGPAMRMYVARGYQFDGRGLMYDRQAVAPGSMVRIDDDATLTPPVRRANAPFASNDVSDRRVVIRRCESGRHRTVDITIHTTLYTQRPGWYKLEAAREGGGNLGRASP